MQCVRRFHSINALRASGDVADVRLQRKLRYDFAKLKAEGRLRFFYQHSHLMISDASLHTSASAITATGSSHGMTMNPPPAHPLARNVICYRLDLHTVFKNIHCIEAIVPQWGFKFPRILLLRVTRPFHQILVLAITTTSL